MARNGYRCPACLADLPPTRPRAVCRWCGAAHHVDCWRGGCAACGDLEPPLAGGASSAPLGGPELTLRGGRAWFESDGEQVVALELDRSGRAAFQVALRNETAARQRVEVRAASPWLACAGPEAIDLPPGETRPLRFTAAGVDHGPGGRPVRGRLVLATEDDSRTVHVTASLAREVIASRRRRGLTGAAAAALCAVLLGGALLHGRGARAEALSTRGLPVRGLVLERSAGRAVDHARWVYEVGGVPYERTGVAGPERPGDPIDLVYLAERPEAAVRRGEAPDAPWPQSELFVGSCLVALALAGWALGQGQSSTCTPISKTRSGGISK